MPSEQEKFLNDLNQPENDDLMNRPLDLDATATEAGTTDETEPAEEPKNRRERRLETKLQAERESAIALAARLEALTEAQKLREGQESKSFEKLAERIFGNQTPEAAEASQLLIESLREVHKTSKEEALAVYREERQREQADVAKETKQLDTMVEDIEDEYGVTMDEKTKEGFFTLLGKLSPKDANGEPVAWADHFEVYEQLQARRQAASQQTTRAKDIASRSMSRTGATGDTKLEDDSVKRFLQAQGWDIH